jgi:hypothetical protein
MHYSGLCEAQPPQSFNYQAALRSADGQTFANQAVLLKISLTDENTTSVYFVEGHQTTTNAQGIVSLQIGSGVLMAGDFSQIPWGSEQIYIKVEMETAGGDFADMGTSRIASVPYALFAGNAGANVTGTGTSGKIALWSDASTLTSLESFTVDPSVEVVSNPQAGDEDPIFEVKNKAGQVVFGVYQSGVRIYVDESNSKAEKGGFAVGGLSTGKEEGNLYFRVTPDSVRVLLRESLGKAEKGGFAVGGLSTGKSVQDLFFIAPDSARIYIDTNPAKAEKGGFAVGGLSTGKEVGEEYLRITRDSARINVLNDSSKAEKGGFAVGGLSTGKTTAESFMYLTPNNYFIGHQAGYSNTSGLYNSFIGFEAGKNITNGDNNIFVGFQSGISNTQWSVNNVFLGNKTCNGAQTAVNSIMIGNRAGFDSYRLFPSGEKMVQNCIYIGALAGEQDKYAQNNIFIGDQAGQYNQLAGNGLFIGAGAGRDNRGEKNVFVGNGTGSNTQGSENVFFGWGSGQFNRTGAKNTYVGFNTGYMVDSSSNNVFIGWNSGYQAKGGSNIYIGEGTGMMTRGTGNVFLGAYAGIAATVSNRLLIGNSVGNVLMVGDFTTYRIGIGNNITPTHNLDVDGNVRFRQITTDPTATTPVYINADGVLSRFSSDKRLKDNIKTIDNASTILNSLRGVEFSWINDPEKTTKIGFIAQEVEDVLPGIVYTSPDTGYKGLNYADLTAVLVEALKEQMKRMDNQEAEMHRLKLENELLKIEVEAIKAKMSK